MAFEEEPQTGTSPIRSTPTMTLEKAVEMGEYEPENLAVFAEWHALSKHLQLSYITQGIKNRTKFLRVQWATIANHPNYSQKPQLQAALRGVEEKLRQVQRDEEKLQIEYLAE